MNYKFRGKECWLDDDGKKVYGKWVYGYLMDADKICPPNIDLTAPDFFDLINFVDPETVGQFKGFDKNGKELYVGDIISDEKSKVLALICFGKIIKEVISDYDKKIKTVEIHGFYYKDLQANRDVLNQAIYPDDRIAFYVGNIHDNPELLEGK